MWSSEYDVLVDNCLYHKYSVLHLNMCRALWVCILVWKATCDYH